MAAASTSTFSMLDLSSSSTPRERTSPFCVWYCGYSVSPVSMFFCFTWNTEAVNKVPSTGWYFSPTSYCSPSLGSNALPPRSGAAVPTVGKNDWE
ncbi:hypothetical protein D3C79_776330 [compost metagenome]